MRAGLWQKQIEAVAVGDRVVSFDDNGNLVPGPIMQLFTNQAKILLTFHGTLVAPGHVYYRHDGAKAHGFETLIDLFRDDGVIQ